MYSRYNVAIIGSGPAACYAASALLKSYPDIRIDIFEKLFCPYGLVRSGVAPDHSKIKSVQNLFEKTLTDSRCNFFGNVSIGEDISIAELKENYSAVILSHGAESDRRLNITGEELAGNYTATEFVAWYNCHQDYVDRNFNLSKVKKIAIIGQGNVAVDVARILAKPISDLQSTDIGNHAIEALSKSEVTDIYVIGRRGPVQAAFTDKELKELGEIANCELIIDKEQLKLSKTDQAELEIVDKVKRSNYKILTELAEKNYNVANKKLHLVFFRSPVEIVGNDVVKKIILEKNILSGEAGNQKALGIKEFEELPVDLIFRSVGYLGKGIENIPFDSKTGVYKNNKGRILDNNQVEIKGLYCSGWIKRGPSGVIGTNKACSIETVNSIIEDGMLSSENNIQDILIKKKLKVITFADWQKIDAEEIRRGEQSGKERVKFVNKDQIFEFLNNLG